MKTATQSQNVIFPKKYSFVNIYSKNNTFESLTLQENASFNNCLKLVNFRVFLLF